MTLCFNGLFGNSGRQAVFYSLKQQRFWSQDFDGMTPEAPCFCGSKGT
jgi:hypothetical protein